MSTGFLLVLVAGPVLLIALAAALGPRRGPLPEDPGVRLRAVARTTTRWRIAGLALGLGLAVYLLDADDLGRGLVLAAPVVGLGVLVGVVGGELRVAPPSGATRTAALEVRRVRDYLPRVLAPVVAAATLTLLGLLAVTTAVGSPDDQGRAGRSLTTTCRVAVDGLLTETTSSTGPWPGAFYSVPLAAALVGGLLAATTALRAVARRPRQGEHLGLDDALRRRAASAVVAAVGVLVGVPLAGVTVTAAVAVQNSCPSVGWRGLAGLLLVLGPAGLLLTGWSVGVLVRPGALLVQPPAAAGAAR